MTKIVPRLFQIWVVNFVSGLCGTNYMWYKWREVPDPFCPFCNHTGVKETVIHQLHSPLLPSIQLFKDSVDSLHKWMKGKDIEPTICVILFWYIRVKVRKIFQDDPHLPMKISSESKAQDNIGWYNMMWVWISRYWDNWKSYYIKKWTSRKTGINW